MPISQSEKAARFRALHEAPGAFVIPNPWDGGSARILAALGFQALATSSGAKAGTLGRGRQGDARRGARAMPRHREATDLPVSADLEKCFGDEPKVVAETIRLAAGVGLVGGSVEDATGDKDKPLFDIGAGHRARGGGGGGGARAAAFPFTLTARTESFLRGNPNLDDVIKRLQAFEKAGADVLMAPGLPDLAAVRAVCSAVSKPVNFMVGIKGKSFTVAELKRPA